MPALKVLLAPGSLSLFAVAILIGVAALWRRGRPARAARFWIAGWTALYAALSLPLVAGMLGAGLSNDPATAEMLAGRQAVIVLSGTARRYRAGDETFEVTDVETALRVREAARVSRLLGAPLVIISGAGGRGEAGPEVQGMRDGLVAHGVAADRIVLESGSRDTRGSAVVMGELLRSRQIASAVLVTSLHHMPRAMRAYRKAGVDVVPSPAPPLGGRRPRAMLGAIVPRADALMLSETYLHEYAGIIYYWLRGWG